MVKSCVAEARVEASSLYDRVLAQRAGELHDQVGAVHCVEGATRAVGWMRIERGRGPITRLAAALLRLPRPGARVPIRLEIDRTAGEERWTRQFGDGTAIGSKQSSDAPGELVELFGALAFVFSLQTRDGQLRFRQQACQLRLAGSVVPIPSLLAPHVMAVAGPAQGRGVAVTVQIRHRLLGVLLTYSGVVTPEDDR